MAQNNKSLGEKPPSNAQKDPDDWVTKDEPSTGAQRSYLHTLAMEAGEDIDENLTKGRASKKIDELEKAFAAWLGLSPNNKVSGQRVLSSRTRQVRNRAATTLRLAAMMLGKTDTPLGAFYRRKRAQLGAPKAITATARKLACLIYRLIKAGQGYQEGDARAYELNYKDQMVRSLRRRAAGLGFELVEAPQAA